MNIKISHKEEQPLLSRIRITGEISFDKETPSRKKIVESLAKSLDKDAALIDVDMIKTAYGQHSATLTGYAYSDASVMPKIKRLGKKALEKTKKQQEAAPAAQ